MVAKTPATHLTVRSTEFSPARGIGIIEPNQCVVVLVKQAVFEPKIFELVEPDSVVVDERSVWCDETDRNTLLRRLRRDRQARWTRTDDEDIDLVPVVQSTEVLFDLLLLTKDLALLKGDPFAIILHRLRPHVLRLAQCVFC